MPALALGQKVLARARSAGVPEELIPAELLVAPVDVAGSAEATYRETVRRFAHHLAAAESRLPLKQPEPDRRFTIGHIKVLALMAEDVARPAEKKEIT